MALNTDYSTKTKPQPTRRYQFWNETEINLLDHYDNQLKIHQPKAIAELLNKPLSSVYYHLKKYVKVSE